MSKVLIGTVAIIVVLIALFLVWRRRALARRMAAIESVARGIRELRMRASRQPPMNPVSEQSGTIPSEFAPITDELKQEGFRMLGDVEELDYDGGMVGRLRWFTSSDNQIYGWFGIAQGHPVMLLLSEDAGRGFAATVRSPHAPSTVVPDTVREFRIRWESGLGEALTGHRAGLHAMAAPVRVTDLAAALASLNRLKEHVAAWRARQDPDTLLQADVRNIVGTQFEDLQPMVLAFVEVLETIDAEKKRMGQA
jgi:hypothetical protein